MTLLLSFYPSLYPFPPVSSKLSPLLCPYASYCSQTEYISVSQSRHACTHLLVLHMMFPLPNTLKKHMHTTFSRLVHLSCASSPRKPSWLRPLSPPTTRLVPAMSWQSTLDHSLYCNYHTHCEVLVTEWSQLNSSKLRDALRNSSKKHTVVCSVRMSLIIFLEPSLWWQGLGCFFFALPFSNGCTSLNRIVFILDSFSIV